MNGILTIVSASLIEKRELTQQEKEEEEKQQQQQQQNNMDVDQQQDRKDKSDQEAQANEPPAPEVCIFIVTSSFIQIICYSRSFFIKLCVIILTFSITFTL